MLILNEKVSLPTYKISYIDSSDPHPLTQVLIDFRFKTLS